MGWTLEHGDEDDAFAAHTETRRATALPHTGRAPHWLANFSTGRDGNRGGHGWLVVGAMEGSREACRELARAWLMPQVPRQDAREEAAREEE